MPHYNWRRSRPSSTESLIPSRQASRSSGSSSSEKRSPSPPNSVDYSHLQIEPITAGNGSQTSTSTGSSRIETDGNGSNGCSSPTSCPTCGLPFEESVIARQPRLMPCLHSFCTQCIQNVYDHLETIQTSRMKSYNSRPSSRYSWRKHHSPNRSNSSSPQSVKSVLGHFMCPFCHNMAIIYNGGREVILSTFPMDYLILNKSTSNKSKTAKWVVIQFSKSKQS